MTLERAHIRVDSERRSLTKLSVVHALLQDLAICHSHAIVIILHATRDTRLPVRPVKLFLVSRRQIFPERMVIIALTFLAFTLLRRPIFTLIF